METTISSIFIRFELFYSVCLWRLKVTLSPLERGKVTPVTINGQLKSLYKRNGLINRHSKRYAFISHRRYLYHQRIYLLNLFLFHFKPHEIALPLFKTLQHHYLIFSATILIVLTFIISLFDTHIVFVSIFAMSARDKRF